MKKLRRNLLSGRFQRTLSALTAISAAGLGFEIYLEHYKGSFADKWMWTPIALTPPLTVAGTAAVLSERVAKTWLPGISALYAADGVIGVVTHLRGVVRKPGGLSEPTYIPAEAKTTFAIGKIDHNVSTNNRLNVRYIFFNNFIPNNIASTASGVPNSIQQGTDFNDRQHSTAGHVTS